MHSISSKRSTGVFLTHSRFRAMALVSCWLLHVMSVDVSAQRCAEWTLYPENPALMPRIGSAMAYDSIRGKTVLYGGHGSILPPGFYEDTWEWDGEWNVVQVSGPSARGYGAMAFDSIRGVCVMFGGLKSTSPDVNVGDTWEWNGERWDLRSTEGPSPRHAHSMCYDELRGVVVLFGGRIEGSGTVLSNETWEWDGRSWSLRTTEGPSARSGHKMAFDSDRNVTVLFGGRFTTELNDTWEWDGYKWELKSTSGPGRRHEHGIAYDKHHQRTVIYGGTRSQPAYYYESIWVWDGLLWDQRRSSGYPGRAWHSMSFDTRRAKVIAFGGREFNGYRNDTRALDASPPILYGDTNCDRIVDAYDLLYIIYAWDWCPDAAACFADVAPAPTGDGTVNVLDLLMVINTWSP